MSSVNFNSAATSALRTLQQTNASLDATQNRISTGLKIGDAKDNAAYWSISTTMKSDNAAMSTVKDALGLGAATVDTAYQGLNAAKDVLDQIKSKLTAATQSGVDKAAIQQEIGQLQKQLQSIASSSTFSGENWLSVNSDLGNSNKSIVASFTREAGNAVSLGTITVSTNGVALFDSGVAKTGIVNGQQTLTDANGNQLAIGGVSTGTAPTTTALVGVTGGSAGSNMTTGSAAKAVMGTIDLTALHKEDRIKFDLTVDGGATRTVTVSTAGITDTGTFLTAINTAISGTFGSAVAVASADASGKLVLTTASTAGAASQITVAASTAVEGNGITSSVLGVSGSALTTYGTATKATAISGSGTAYSAPGANWTGGDSLTVNYTVDGTVYQAVVTGGLTTTSTSADVATALQTAMNLGSGGAAPANSVTVTYNGTTDKFEFATVGTGEAKSVSILSTVAAGANAGNFGITNSGTTNMGTSSVATYAAGTLNTAGVDKGDTIAFDVNASGVTKRISISTEGFTGTTASDRALFVARVQNALDNGTSGFGANQVKVAVDSGSNAISFSTVAKGTAQFIGVDNVVATDGDGQTTGKLGIVDVAIQSGTPGNPAAKATAVGTSAFSGPLALDDDDSLSFNVAVNGAAAKTIVITKAVINTALGVTTGSIANIANLATVVQSALTTAGIPSSSVVASDDGSGRLKLEAATAGAGSITVSDAVGFSGSNKVSVNTIDITTASFKALSESDQRTVLTAYTKVVNDAITKVTAAAANLGAVSSRIDLQNSFVSKLMDTIEKGVSGLVDADMNEESTKLQALQVKQQLGVQALSIANQSAQSVLSLFRS